MKRNLNQWTHGVLAVYTRFELLEDILVVLRRTFTWPDANEVPWQDIRRGLYILKAILEDFISVRGGKRYLQARNNNQKAANDEREEHRAFSRLG
jgi:hypothetical protein